jgi:hypothetical protein
VRVYSPGGAFLFDFGREGGGPGEFRMPVAVKAARDGWQVDDPGLGRTVLLSFAADFEGERDFLSVERTAQTREREYLDCCGSQHGLLHAWAHLNIIPRTSRPFARNDGSRLLPRGVNLAKHLCAPRERGLHPFSAVEWQGIFAAQHRGKSSDVPPTQIPQAAVTGD